MFSVTPKQLNRKHATAFIISVLFTLAIIHVSNLNYAPKVVSDNIIEQNIRIQPRDASTGANTIVMTIETLSANIYRAVITVTGGLSVIEVTTNDMLKKYQHAICEDNQTTDRAKSTEIKDDKANQNVDNSDNDNLTVVETVLSFSTLNKLRTKLNCSNKSFERKAVQRGEYWVLGNFIQATHGPVACYEDVTFTTHSDFTFLDNLVPLVQRWSSPISVAMHTPGYDLSATIDSIRYMRDCSEAAELIKKWVTFHMFFHRDHLPEKIPNVDETLQSTFDCSLPEPYIVDSSAKYSSNRSLLYPVNVGRNIAREAALTHYVFPADIELYPSPHLAARFLNMIARDPPILNGTNPKVFPLVLFEVEEKQQVPKTKAVLQTMLQNKTAIPFHITMCPQCHNVPKFADWVNQADTGKLDVFTVGKRKNEFQFWEPIFIGTNDDPLYEERLSWEGKSDKMTQGFVMCVKDYDYMILNNAFLTHRPGIKLYVKDAKRDNEVMRTNDFIRNVIFKELNTVYGTAEGCVVK